MADEQRQQPTERTPIGYEVPVPKRNEFFGNLKKAAEPEPAERDRDGGEPGKRD
jgi:hypothetical protein